MNKPSLDVACHSTYKQAEHFMINPEIPAQLRALEHVAHPMPFTSRCAPREMLLPPGRSTLSVVFHFLVADMPAPEQCQRIRLIAHIRQRNVLTQPTTFLLNCPPLS
jgi:hypothetical protein